MVIGAVCIRLYLPGCNSLKDKRGLLKPLLARLHKEFNVAAAETDLQEVWQSAEVGVVAVSNEGAHAEAALRHIVNWIERNRPEVEVVDAAFELR